MRESVAIGPIDRFHDLPHQDLTDFDAVAELYRPKVFRFALASLGDADAANTITQDCLLRVYQARSRFRGECSLNSWIMRIAVNLVRDYQRNRRLRFWKRTMQATPPPETLAASEDASRSPEERAALRERVEAVWRATRSLPDRQRTVFLLRFVQDMDILEIAVATGMKEGTVKTHLFRALQAVRESAGEVE